MPWFPVDDKFHSHPKVMVTSPAALGLWVVAGSWSSDYGTDGVIRDDQISRLLPDAATLATELVTSGLWKRTRGGYAFHDWTEWGSKRTGAEDKELRAKRAESGRLGGLASGKAREAKSGKPGHGQVTTAAEATRSQSAGRTPGTAQNGRSDGNTRSKHEASCLTVASGVASPGLEPQIQSQSIADVSNLPHGSRELASGDVIEAIIQEIYDRTSRVVDAGWADKIAGNILGDRHVRDPVGYCRKAIRTDPDPKVRFLPHYPETAHG